MRSRLALVLALGLCLASSAARSASVDLRTDERLSTRLTLNEPMIAVHRLLTRLSAECRLELDTEPELRGATVCLAAKDQLCSEVLEQLAQALGYRWTLRSPKPGQAAYRLTEDDGARLRRSTLARQHRRETGEELVLQLDLLDRAMRKLGAASRRDVRDELERMEAAVNALPTSAERYRAELELRAAEQATNAETRPFLLALGALSPSARERLLNGERLVMAARRPGALPMPEPVLLALQEGRRARAREEAPPGGAPAANQTPDEALDFVSEVSWGQLTVYSRARWLPGQRQRLSFAAPTYLQTQSLVAHGPSSSDLRPGKVTASRPEQLRTLVPFTWPGKKLQANQPLTWYPGVTVAEVLSRLAAVDPQWRVSGGALLEGLATVQSAPPTVPETAAMLLARLDEKGRAGALPLGELLRPLAERGGVDIEVKSDGWIRFRSTLYHRERERQVDPVVLKDVFGTVMEGKPFTPEVGMSAGRSLAREQLTTLGVQYLAFPRQLTQNSGLRSTLDAWRLVATLPEADRQSLVTGAPLTYARLKEPARAAVRAYLRSVSLRPNGAPLDLELTPRDLPALRLHLAPSAGLGRALELRLGTAEPPIYTATLEAQWPPNEAAPAFRP